MRLLLVKTSSLGDVIHTLPALTEAKAHYPNLEVDWVVEEGFSQIPSWHPAVVRVIPVAIRRWRKRPWRAWRSGELPQLLCQLAAAPYDCILDAQGLLKSAWLTRCAQGPIHGLAKGSAREGLASYFYHQRHQVARDQHAVTRVRQLFAQSLDYPLRGDGLDYGVTASLSQAESGSPYVMFMHGTTWASKHWPQAYWQQLAELVVQGGWEVRLPWGNAQELQRAEAIAAAVPGVMVLPRLNLTQLAEMMAQAQGCVAVDTGLGHLAAALAVPCISLYGATNPGWTGTHGVGQVHLQAEYACAPCLARQCRVRESEVQPACFATLPPARVWQGLQQLMGRVD